MSSEAAFSELVARHGSMVMGICTRMIGDSQIAPPMRSRRCFSCSCVRPPWCGLRIHLGGGFMV